MRINTLLKHVVPLAVLAMTLPNTAEAQCTGNRVVVSILTDGNADQTTWEIRQPGGLGLIAAGGPYTGQNFTQINDTVCLGAALISKCYRFRLMDSFGDGLSGVGNWKLTTTDGKLLLADDFATGTSSPVDPPESGVYTSHFFCLPVGPANIPSYECGLFNNRLNNKVHCTAVPGATSYQFEISDPDNGLVFRIQKNVNYFLFSDCNTVSPLIPGARYFVHARSNASGAFTQERFGSGCEMGLGLPEVVHCTPLISFPEYGHSCNETRAFGSAAYSFIYAKPVLGATAYTFHIYIPGEPTALDTTITRSTYILQLKWPGTPMVEGSTYNVDVRTTVNGLTSDYCAPSCTITIDNSYVGEHLAPVEAGAGTALQMWPNPVVDGQMHLTLDGLVDADQRIQVTMYDMYGKQVLDHSYGNSGSNFSTMLALPSGMANGIYMVNITVNGKTTLQRVSVMR